MTIIHFSPGLLHNSEKITSLIHTHKRYVYNNNQNRRLASEWIHCAGSATYEVTDPELKPEP